MILTVTLNPSIDKTLFVKELKVGDTNRVIRTETDAGGKGVNLSRIVVELGGKSLATGFLGGGAGAHVRSVLDDQGVEHEFVRLKGVTRTNVSIETEAQDAPTTFNSPGPNVGPEEWQRLLDRVAQLAKKAKWTAFGGSLPPGCPPDAFKRLIEVARESGSRSALDADGDPLKVGIEANPEFIKPNAKEAGRLLGSEVKTDQDAIAACKKLYERGIPYVIVSRGAKGAVLACDGGLFSGVSPTIEARSTVGSGDSLIAGFLWALEEGKQVDEALRYGLAAGAATALSDGTDVGRREDILRLLEEAEVRRL